MTKYLVLTVPCIKYVDGIGKLEVPKDGLVFEKHIVEFQYTLPTEEELNEVIEQYGHIDFIQRLK